ncbi:MAG: hypothetical protein ACE5JG_11490, partial [Planctomycetota bacterium]
EHTKAEVHKKGAVVVNYAAWAVAYQPLVPQAVGQGGEMELYSPYTSLDVSAITQLKPKGSDIPLLTRADWERVLPHVTIWSKGPVSDGWANVQAVEEGTGLPGKEGDPDRMLIQNQYHYNVGTVVRLQEKAETNADVQDRAGEREKLAARPKRRDYGMVYDSRPAGESQGRIELFGQAHRTFHGNRMQVQYRTSQPVNVNTASREVLVALFANLRLRLREDSVTRDEAAALADAILKRRQKPETALRSHEEFEALLRDLEDQGLLTSHDRRAIYRNALNCNDQALIFGTAPICFRTYDVYTLASTALVNGRGGKLLAKHRESRVVEVGSQVTTERAWDTQRELEEQLVFGRDQRYWTTGPINTGRFKGPNIEPWPRWPAHLLLRHFPWDPYSVQAEEERAYRAEEGAQTQAPSNGWAQLAPQRAEFDSARVDPAFVDHFDDEEFVEGRFVTDGYPVDLNGPVLKAVQGSLVQPFGIQFWYQPREGSGGSDEIIFDVAEDTFLNRVTCFVDRAENQLVFAVSDDTSTQRACELRYDLSEQGGFLPDVWYHIQLVATGCHPSQMAMLVDGRAVGEHNVMTFLKGGVGTDDSSVPVEDGLGFPSSGALLIGSEVVEYESRSGTEFTVRATDDGKA